MIQPQLNFNVNMMQKTIHKNITYNWIKYLGCSNIIAAYLVVVVRNLASFVLESDPLESLEWNN
jgi:hypothetical protein